MSDVTRTPQYYGHVLISLPYNLAWSVNREQAKRLKETLQQIDPHPTAIDEPSEAELHASNIHLPPGCFLKVTYLIEATTQDEATTVLRTIVSCIEAQNQPTWWFLNAQPIEAK